MKRTRLCRLLAAAFALSCAAPATARAGPVEARARWKEAVLSKGEPWPERVRLLRAVRAAAGPADPILSRAAMAESKVLRGAGRMGGAAAAEAFAAGFGPPHDPERLGYALSAAREAHAEGDVFAAEAWLHDVVEHGGGAAPLTTAPALLLLGRLAYERSDAADLDRLARRAAEDVPRAYDDRLDLLDLAGLARLSLGNEAGARRVLLEQHRLYDEARRQGPAAERLAAKAWAGLEIPKRLS